MTSNYTKVIREQLLRNVPASVATNSHIIDGDFPFGAFCFEHAFEAHDRVLLGSHHRSAIGKLREDDPLAGGQAQCATDVRRNGDLTFARRRRSAMSQETLCSLPASAVADAPSCLAGSAS
jgi:hypothetical protein